MHYRMTAVCLGVLFVTPAARSDFILTTFASAGPDNAWAYFSAVGVGKHNSTTYVPTLADSIGIASFQGYVAYPAPGPSGNSLGWIHYQPSLYDEDTTRIFRTFVRASQDVTIPLVVGGDDGHSIYVNNKFVGGEGFGPGVKTDLTLKAGSVTEIDLLGYNGPGPWELVIQRQDGSPFADTPGITLNADGQFAVVPGPPSILLAAAGGLCLAVVGWMRRRPTATR